MCVPPSVFRLVLTWVGLAALLIAPAEAQFRSASGTQEETEEPDTQDNSLSTGALVPGPGGGLEEAVDPDVYRMGPGDVLVISVWGPKPLMYQVPVTLEGKVIIPEVGELDVDGLTLRAAQDRIRGRVLGAFRGVDVSVTLTALRRFQVHVLGQVENPGTYLGTAVDRVSTAVSWAGGLLENAGQRQIQVLQEDQVRVTADLFSFLERGDRSGNPPLEDGDIILVPYTEDRMRVLGAVNRPGGLEFVRGDRFSTALRLAGGFTAEVQADTIEVARYPHGTVDPLRFFVTANGTLTPGPGMDPSALPVVDGTFSPPPIWLPQGNQPIYPDFELESNDILFVRRIPNIRQQRLVEVQGEVRFPGSYPVQVGVTRISDVIDWSGGLTPEASLAEAQLIRREAIGLQDRELARLQQMAVADMREDEYNYFKMKSRSNPGSMVVDFRAALSGDPDTDLLLERGDLIVIPKRKDFVTVIGVVLTPGNVKYRPGLDAKDYVALAGGFGEDAKKGDTQVVRADGGEWVKAGEAGELRPGDTVMVPEKPESNFWQIFRDTLLITTQLLAIFIVIDNAIK